MDRLMEATKPSPQEEASANSGGNCRRKRDARRAAPPIASATWMDLGTAYVCPCSCGRERWGVPSVAVAAHDFHGARQRRVFFFRGRTHVDAAERDRVDLGLRKRGGSERR